MNREQWINESAARFAWASCSAYMAKQNAINEFRIRCRDEPLDSAPELPVDHWPDPREAADDAMREWEIDDWIIQGVTATL